jgi:hypothetical protein
MRLSSDHVQWYDGIFDDQGPEFHRIAFARGGLRKREQLELFDRIGLCTPPHGLVAALARRLAGDQRLVVYEDELEHRGRGKLLLSVEAAVRTHPDRYASLFVPPAGSAEIIRHVRFGRLGFWLHQRSTAGDWRSNVADQEELLGRSLHQRAPIARVLWAIDFLPSAFGLLAVDFNTAPELSTLGERRAATTEELAMELARATPEELEQL